MVPKPPEPAALPAVAEDSERVECQGFDETASLASEVDSHLVRGVALDICLRGWGSTFRSSGSDRGDSYSLSKVTPRISAFLSHDWQTGRLSKTLALLLVFNSMPAASVSLFTVLLSSGLLALGWLPGGWPTGCAAAYGTFYLVLFFWQRLQRLWCSETLVFLDKLCIAQHNDELKRRLGLGICFCPACGSPKCPAFGSSKCRASY